ncbi:MAG: phosphoribosylanthranilate isomerase [Pyrinomonadaceae bacterium]
MTKVKICGITNLADAKLVADLGADMIGFNFYTGSKRYVSPAHAASFADVLTGGITRVGVFVDASVHEILLAKRLVQLDGIQLHGNESPRFIAELRDKVDATMIKAIRVRSALDIDSAKTFGADAILLDAYSSVDFGGTGETFDWRFAERAGPGIKLLLAGGLTPENVAEAIRNVRPYAVDVASGVESSPGTKDTKKLEAFIKNAKNA